MHILCDIKDANKTLILLFATVAQIDASTRINNNFFSNSVLLVWTLNSNNLFQYTRLTYLEPELMQMCLLCYMEEKEPWHKRQVCVQPKMKESQNSTRNQLTR